jgi:hypothetical protein
MAADVVANATTLARVAIDRFAWRDQAILASLVEAGVEPPRGWRSVRKWLLAL